ncbi:hypothetical protein BD830_11615 [Maritimibacter alkaliphilus HTCC2654]|uniref:Uncharacterized protein n=1 Tax=Maritimibacter alkaliphilus HTCC2654 TaxID=314271 RepID=A3VBG2_9RHOB|nr:hypothetical protein [Maritimibacter alkaliphilus]EAQ14295.1 hypothetical protein RB2654_16536 [Rhodobacterales bacterium HTCC2654] [Maritimibacter alkaliphilus HTCC2654]TYP78508.1 hypothetical protein BD830_11615 [Maritimibacter alkaliphilus HTCC2654]
MSSRPFSFPMAALAAGMKAKDGRATPRDGIALSILLLGDPLRLDDDASEAVRFYLDGIACGDQARAGAALVDWVQAQFPAQVEDPPEYDWQRRADCGR